MKRVELLLVNIILWGINCFAVDNATIFAKIAEKGTTTNTIQCTFVETRHATILKKDMVKNGQFYYEHPDKICMDYHLPKGDLLLMKGDKFVMLSRGKRSEMNAQTNPMVKQLRQMLIACMTGDLSHLKVGKNSEITIEERETLYVITISLNGNTKSLYNRIILSYDKGDLSLNTLRMCEPNDNYTEYCFSAKVFNKKISAEIFDR